MAAGPETDAQPPVGDLIGQARAREQARVTRRLRRRQWFSSTVLLVLAFVIMGVAPIALLLRLFGVVRLPNPPVPGFGNPASVQTATPHNQPTATAPELGFPRSAWIANTTSIYVDPQSALTSAQLQPGFPVTVQAVRTVSGTRWYQITWAGPTAATNGHGWVPEAALANNGITGPAVGDAAALSPTLASALSPLGSTVALAVYFPKTQQLYLNGNGDTAYTLGTGARSLVLAALVANLPPATTGTPSATTPMPTLAPAQQGLFWQQVATGDPTSTAQAYQQLDTAAGLDTFANAFVLTGITPGAQDWTQTQATPRALVQFYAELGNQSYTPTAGQLDSAARTHVLSLLTAPPPTPTTVPPELSALVIPPAVGAHVALIVGTEQGSAGWSVNVAGLVTLPSGLTYVEAICIQGASSRVAGANALRSAQNTLATVMGQ